MSTRPDPVLDPDLERFFRNRILHGHKVADPSGSGSTTLFCVNSIAFACSGQRSKGFEKSRSYRTAAVTHPYVALDVEGGGAREPGHQPNILIDKG
jgi:hypothetical protein